MAKRKPNATADLDRHILSRHPGDFDAQEIGYRWRALFRADDHHRRRGFAGGCWCGGGSSGWAGVVAQIASHYFADGGIMTSMGSVTLNKSANGGIANSPQVAMFGEGRGPKAYVPLPDGRSIPVSMKSRGPS